MPIGVDVQDGQADPGCPCVAILPDWATQQQMEAAFGGMDVRLYRIMGRDQWRFLPDKAHVVYDNEDDAGDDRSWRLPLVAKIRAERSDLVIHCPPEKWFEREQYDPVEMAACDVVDLHEAVFEDPATVLAWLATASKAAGVSKPFWVTELEADPAHPEQMDQLVPAAAAWDAQGIPCFIWGSDPFRADVNDRPDLLAAIIAHNKGEPPVADPTIADVQAGLGDMAQALYTLGTALIVGATPKVSLALFEGPTSLFGQLNAIDPVRFPVPNK